MSRFKFKQNYTLKESHHTEWSSQSTLEISALKRRKSEELKCDVKEEKQPRSNFADFQSPIKTSKKTFKHADSRNTFVCVS